MHATWFLSVWISLVIGWWWIYSSYYDTGSSLHSWAPNHSCCHCLTEVLLKTFMTCAFVVFGNIDAAYESNCVLWVYYSHGWKLQEACMVSSTHCLEFGTVWSVSDHRCWSGGRCCSLISAWLVFCFILAIFLLSVSVLWKLSMYLCPYIWTERQESPVWSVNSSMFQITLAFIIFHLTANSFKCKTVEKNVHLIQ